MTGFEGGGVAMGEFLKRLFDSDLMPHGACWGWEPWVVWSNVISDLLIALCYVVIPMILIYMVRKRRDVLSNPVVGMFGAFIFSCGCTHAMDVYNTWHGLFRAAGLVKAVTAAVSLLTVVPLLKLIPKLLAVPELTRVLAMDAALSNEKQEKHHMEGQLRETRDHFRLLVEGAKDYALILLDPDGLVTSWNPGAEGISGYTEADILGHSFSALFPAEDRAAGKPGQILAQAARDGRIEYEGEGIRKDGTTFLVHEVITPLF